MRPVSYLLLAREKVAARNNKTPMTKTNGTEKKAVVVAGDNSAEGLISQAISKGVDVGTLERLLAMRTQIKAEQAKEAFNRALAAFQATCPTIVKTKAVTTRDGRTAYKYAPIESIVAQVKPYLQTHGFSYTTQIDLTEKGVKATCKVTHEAGHVEESSMEVPLGSKTQVMSDSQVTAAASTFAKRYAFCNAFGILTGDEDNDGAKFDTSPVEDKSIPTVSYDDHESMAKDVVKRHTMPWSNPQAGVNLASKATVATLKRKIKNTVDKIVLMPLETGEEYTDYVKQQTGLDLGDTSEANLQEIITRLEAVAF